MSGATYKAAGVNLELYEEAMGRLPALMARTHTPRVVPLLDGFAGLFRLQGDGRKYEDPVLVSGTDGVGTKLKVAQRCRQFRTVGIDLVGMCVNDCLCLGAEPLFFLDYLALDRDHPDLIADLVAGVSDGCVEAGCALIGGETAIMPAVYPPDEFDLAGFCVGVVEKSQLIDGKAIRPGDVLLGVRSSGFHSNGYSLIRHVVFELAQLQVEHTIAELGETVGEALLRPTRIYAKLVKVVMQSPLRPAISAMAHITGGGLQDNLARLLPEGVQLTLDRQAWTPQPVFPWIQQLGQIDRDEMYHVFNMGIGYVFVVRPEAAEGLSQLLHSQGETVIALGTAASGPRGVSYKN